MDRDLERNRVNSLAATEARESAASTPATGSLIVERYVWKDPARDRTGVQWLAQVVNKEGNWELVKVCKTRAEALVAICEEAQIND